MQTSSTRSQENDTAHSEDLTAYRNSPAEIARVDDLMRLIPSGLHTALDIGARDGHISKAIAQKVAKVTALDLECPQFSCPGVTTVKGDATSLNFPDKSIDLVFCAEVLEHLPGKALHLACAEMARVASSYVLVGVPYKQDLRQGKTTCCLCGATNPPWGHVNSFDEARLAALFPTLKMTAVSYVGTGAPGTNALSSKLMDYAGNPFGTYFQAEGCVYCGEKLRPAPRRSVAQKVATRTAFVLDRIQAIFLRSRGNWIHVLLSVQ